MNNSKEFLKYAVHHHGMSSHMVEDYISATQGPVAGPENMTQPSLRSVPPFREVTFTLDGRPHHFPRHGGRSANIIQPSVFDPPTRKDIYLHQL